ncbi:helix-turn-helix transcriptional regulator [Paenibacillus aurantiacus]|uniref:Helix-turn-helix transcriptional regulator n=1 Tax=Paenibacillus aurantiacus TaxID=1936118 RepID=A0ABV5KP19_9BACL
MKNVRIIALREARGLTQGKLAKEVGMTQSMISHVEAGRKEPSKKYKINLARFFDVTVEWLFYEEIDDLKSLDNTVSA